MSKRSGIYRGVKTVKRVPGGLVFERVLIEIQTYKNRTYHFAIKPNQLKKLLKGGK